LSGEHPNKRGLQVFKFVAIALAVVGLVDLLRRGRRKRPVPEALFRVECSEEKIEVISPQGELRVVTWQALTGVGIRTTDEGPWSPDVFWGLHENNSTSASVVFPGGSTGEPELIRAMQERLPGFRNEEFIRAMQSTWNSHFVVWERGDLRP
jgi:hypothetical protein